jgi:transposase
MDMIGKVRRMKLRDQLSLSEIAKRTGMSRNTIKKWLKAPSDVVPKYERGKFEGKLSAYEPTLDQALTTDSHRPKQGRRSGRALFAQIRAQGYRGGYSAVTDYIRRWRVESVASPTNAFVPLSFELGEAFQFDWSDEAMVVGGVFYNVQVAHLKLCASRAFWLVAYPSQGHEMLFDAHTRSFQALGGVTRRGIYDNMRTAVDKVQRGKQRIVNARFSAMCSHYLFDPDFCNVASGWEKGVVEKNVQDSRRRIWIEASTRRFGSFVELNAWLGERCRSVWADTAHPIHRQFTVAEMWELEKGHLMSMPTPFDGYVERLARVSSTCLVVAARNRYSVPCEWAGQIVSTRVYPGRIDVASADAVVASHARLPGCPAVARPATTGSTTSTWCSASRAPCATARRSWICLHRCCACASPCFDIPAGTGPWPRCWPWCPRPGLRLYWWQSNWCSKAWRPAAASASSMCATCWPA